MNIRGEKAVTEVKEVVVTPAKIVFEVEVDSDEYRLLHEALVEAWIYRDNNANKHLSERAEHLERRNAYFDTLQMPLEAARRAALGW